MALLDIFKGDDGTAPPAVIGQRTTELRKKLRWFIGEKRDSQFMTITPEMASVMMERNIDEEWHNRPHSEKGLRRYVAGMKRGWKVTGEAISFAKNGRLLNGQHRLMACIESGCSFECLVVVGLDEDVFKYYDIGVSRTAAHIFDIENIPNANAVAASARLLYGYKSKVTWDGRSPDVENDVLLDFYQAHPRLQDTLAPARALYSERLVTMRWGSFLFYICAEKGREQAKEFFEKVATGVGLSSKSSAAFLIRKRLLENARTSNGQLNDTFIGAYFIQAWNSHRRGESRKIFRWRTEQSPAESFPRAE